jgi:hypothetical protein
MIGQKKVISGGSFSKSEKNEASNINISDITNID